MQMPQQQCGTGSLLFPPHQQQAYQGNQQQAFLAGDNSDDEEEGEDADIPDDAITWDDISSKLAHQQDEDIFLQHRFAERRWKKWFGGRKKGGYRPRPQHYPAMAYNSGRKNPMGKDGQIMRCSTCNADDHLRARCPKKPGGGKPWFCIRIMGKIVKRGNVKITWLSGSTQRGAINNFKS
jgi:hypothetical protein